LAVSVNEFPGANVRAVDLQEVECVESFCFPDPLAIEHHGSDGRELSGFGDYVRRDVTSQAFSVVGRHGRTLDVQHDALAIEFLLDRIVWIEKFGGGFIPVVDGG